ncbi:hypothetical protein H4W26_000743 [Nesterenkonia halotolerans]|uniref:Uncharacterized protein n=1 Tax=Nesterenkonia halotolerans TaxID=225325 RepID=A0ABR9J4S1_9MICC|nr:hypothetical protein [Nesterenkonia halotolerans]
MEYRQPRFRLTRPRATALCGAAEPGASAVDRGWQR